jgi:ketosteroid isomerase-like protein
VAVTATHEEIPMHDVARCRTVELFLSALNTLDIAGLLAAVSDDFTLELQTAPEGLPRAVTSKTAFREVMKGVTAMWAEFELTRWAAYPVESDRVVAEYASRGKNLDGSDYRNTYLAMATVRNGKITRWQEFFDPAPFVRSAAIAAAIHQLDPLAAETQQCC